MISSSRISVRVLPKLAHPVWQFLFFLTPLLLLIVISFWTIQNYQLTPTSTVDNYKTIINSSVYTRSFLLSFWLAVSTASLAALFALPLAYSICFHINGRWRNLLIFALLFPFLSSYVVRMFSWQLWLNDNGILAFLLRWLRLDTSTFSFIYNGTAVRIGLLSVLLPIATLIIYVSLVRIDLTLISAARNLGASPWQTFWRIILPFSLPGLAVASLISFIISFGDFISTSILGGNQIYTVSALIADRVKINDWPTAAALGTLMLSISVLIIAMTFSGLRFLPTVRYGKRRWRSQ